jgi:hypothetical protein
MQYSHGNYFHIQKNGQARKLFKILLEKTSRRRISWDTAQIGSNIKKLGSVHKA